MNVFGIFNTARTFLKHFRENRKDTIVNIGSMAGKTTLPLITTYNSTKFAVEGFTETLSYELSSLGIKVKLVEPGSITSDFIGRSMDYAQSETITDYEEFSKKFLEAALRENDQLTSPPVIVAEVIYEAITDNTDTLRYIAGEERSK